MKTKVATLCLLILSVLSAEAKANRRYGMAGCGLGSAVVGRDGSQISAATTNSTSYSKYFGITFATSNCFPDDYEQAMFEQDSFMMNNYAVLAKEMAQGHGQTLDTLAHLLGCNDENLDQFKQFARVNYTTIFAPPGALAALDTLKDSIQDEPTLSQNCTKVALRNEVVR